MEKLLTLQSASFASEFLPLYVSLTEQNEVILIIKLRHNTSLFILYRIINSFLCIKISASSSGKIRFYCFY